MKPRHALEEALALGAGALLRAMGWRRSLGAGAAVGEALLALGLRRRVAEANLAIAFPEAAAAERAAILHAHYRELGRVAAEYTRLAALARTPLGEVIAEVRGLEHLIRAREGGRGAIMMSGHFGNFELMGAFVSQSHPMDFVVRPLSNPGVERWIRRERLAAGVGLIPEGSALRRVYRALAANRCVPMLADQDARRHGVFVPFFGRAASTAIGPARLALATGAPMIMGFITRRPDGRHEIELEPPLEIEDRDAPGAAERLTALHVARLERWVRRRPEAWFWLHRRWKTTPPERAETEADPPSDAALLVRARRVSEAALRP